MLKKIIILFGLLIAAIVLAVGGLYAKGGSSEVLLWFVKIFVRQEHAPNREVTWAIPSNHSNGNQPNSAAKPPNIILIVADDLGFNDITLNGGGLAGGTVPTPNINSLAQEGANFQTSYSGNATCAPSRAAIMTGRYPTRFGFEFTPTPKQFMKVIGNYKGPNQLYDAIYHAEREKDLIPYETMGLPRSEITMAKLLKGQGYRTLHVGKWHLGDAPEFRSHVHGFDEALSFQHGSSLYLPENDPNVVNSKQSFDIIDQFQWAAGSFGMHFNGGEVFKPKRYVTDYLTDEAEKAIEANRSQPFFLYLAYTAPHTPLQATKEDYEALSHIEDHTLRVYAAMVRNLDRNIGRVLQSLKDKGLDDNTLVIFTSDNGGAHYVGLDGLNKPYRGWKATFFEGGIRVPLFMK
ncbi:MAG: sulfatase, partial [Betaproteobacteria bacterium]|nr:sulfatase [Betaproteobacteria bacterium]